MRWSGVVLAAVSLAACATPEVAPPDTDAARAEAAAPSAPPDSVADWSAAFEAEGAVGTFVLYDAATGRTTRHDPERAATRFSPASTSKVFNSLVFLDRGVVADVDSVHAWDGVERSVPQWNRDHSLRTGVQYSAVWLFQRLAGRVGRGGYAAVFAREPYGNSALSDSLETSWLDGTWRVSADEQVAFFDRLRRGDLAFSAADQATVRDLVPVLAEGGGTTVRGKTGWGQPPGEPEIGWIVGWVERPDGDVVFAMNAEEAPGEASAGADLRFDVGPGRLRIVRAVLEGAGVWPVDEEERP